MKYNLGEKSDINEPGGLSARTPASSKPRHSSDLRLHLAGKKVIFHTFITFVALKLYQNYSTISEYSS